MRPEMLLIAPRLDRRLRLILIDKIARIASGYAHSFAVVHVVAGFEEGMEDISLPPPAVVYRAFSWKRRSGFLGVHVILYRYYMLLLFLNCLRLIRARPKITVISNSWGHVDVGLIIILLCKLYGRKSIIRVGGDDLRIMQLYSREARENRLASSVAYLLGQAVESSVFEGADRIHFFTRTSAERHPQFAKKSFIQPPFNPMIGELCRRPLSEPKPGRLIYVGRLEWEKGVQTLLAALPGSGCTECLIVGDGSMFTTLKNRAEELGLAGIVKFVGQVTHEEAARLMQGSYVFVLPSYTEEYPHVLIEAAALGLPSIASDVKNVRHFATDLGTCLTFPIGDASDLRATISRLITDKKLWRDLREEGRRKTCAYYDTSKLRLSYEQMVRGLLADND